ncbi:MAG: DMT family transporter [Henriciella sp.]
MTDQNVAAEPHQMPVWGGPLLVFLGGASVGLAPIGLRYGLDDLGPQAIAFWRYTFAVPLLFLLVLGVKRTLPARPNPAVIIAGICFALEIGFWHWGLTYTSVASATFLVNLGNIGVGLTAWVILKERPSSIWAIAAVIALIGAAGLSLGGGPGNSQAHPMSLRGDLLSLFAALILSGYIVASKVARRTLDGLDAIFWLTLVECLVAGLLVVIFGEAFLPADLSGFAVPLFLAIFVQIVGQGLIILGLGHTPTSIAGILIVVQPVVAAILSWHLFGEWLTVLQLSGCGLILFAIILAQTRRRTPMKAVTKYGSIR